jgi:hypothetical protein
MILASVPPTNSTRVFVWALCGILALAACSGAEARSGTEEEQEQDSRSTAPGQTGSTGAGTSDVSDAAMAGTAQRQDADPRKHALIVAIAKYREASRYSNLHADNDVPLVRGALLTQGFDEGNITVLADRDATREGIVSALSELEERVSPGDIVVFHYSGHGHQITDDDGDELDGYDEILVPYGAPMIVGEGEDPASYDGAEHLRDEELGEWMLALRAKVGPSGNVVAFIDACYSGTGTRAPYELPTRGVREPIGPPAATARASRDEGSGADDLAGAGTRSGEADASLAPFVVISATQADELDHEQRAPDGQIVGPLSLALSRTLPGAGPITYRALFDRIKRDMADVPAQTPLIEGDADTQLFNGQAVAQAPYYEVLEVIGEGERTDTVILGGGRLAGLLEGTRIALYEAGTEDPAEGVLRAEGIVTASYETDAELLLDEPLGTEGILGSWAFVTQFGLGDRVLKIYVDDELGSAARQAIRDTLGRIEGVELTQEDAELAVVGSEGGSVLVMRAAQNAPFLDPLVTDPDDLAGEVVDRILAYARMRDLQAIELRDVGFGGRLELIPASHEIRRRGRSEECVRSELLDIEGYMKAGNLTLADGDDFLLRVTNEGEEDAYAAVLEFLADGEIAQLIPAPGIQAERIPAGSSKLLEEDCFTITPPLGNEVMKLFLTTDPIDFRPLLESQGRTRSATETPLQRLLAESFTGVRSGNTRSSIATGYTAEVMVRIVPEEGGSN